MINGIDYDRFKLEFLSTQLGQRVQQDFDEVTCSLTDFPSILVVRDKFETTCRELLGSNELTLTRPKTTLSIVSFYYLKFLQEINPKKIYDFGCGWNIWKRYIPNIIGVDGNSKYADVLDSYNIDYIKKHQRKFDAAFTINMDAGLHTVPCTFEEVVNEIYEFSTIIRPGGRGYVSLSCIGPFRFTPKEWYTENNCTELTVGDNIKERLLKLPLKILVLDCKFDMFRNHAGHDGELRVVFEVPDVDV
jgi:hypothetical protein